MSIKHISNAVEDDAQIEGNANSNGIRRSGYESLLKLVLMLPNAGPLMLYLMMVSTFSSGDLLWVPLMVCM